MFEATTWHSSFRKSSSAISRVAVGALDLLGSVVIDGEFQVGRLVNRSILEGTCERNKQRGAAAPTERGSPLGGWTRAERQDLMTLVSVELPTFADGANQFVAPSLNDILQSARRLATGCRFRADCSRLAIRLESHRIDERPRRHPVRSERKESGA